MENKYTVDYFIKKFEAIPEDKIVSASWFNPSDSSSCAMGHCGVRHSNDITSLEEAKALYTLFWTKLNTSPILINDGDVDRYKQPTPKQRILAALYDIKKMQEPIEQDAPEKPHESIRYVTVKLDEQVQKLTKNLVFN